MCVTRQRLVYLARLPWNSQSTKVHALKTQSTKVSNNNPLAHALRGDTLGPFTPSQLPVVLFGRAKIHIRNAWQFIRQRNPSNAWNTEEFKGHGAIMEQNNCASLQVALKLKPLKNMNIKVTQRPRVLGKELFFTTSGRSVTVLAWRQLIKKKKNPNQLYAGAQVRH